MRSRFLQFMAAMAAFFVLAVPGCASSPGNTGQQDGLSGGDDALGSSVNLKDVSIEMQGDTTLVHLSFVNGSRYADVEESKISSVPLYEVTELSDPPRLCVSLAIGLSDFAQAGTVFQESVVTGLFDCDIAGSAMKQLYLQLEDPVHAACTADGPTLTLELAPRQRQDASAWFLGLNAVAQYMNGLLPQELEFTPTLCDDFSNVILISPPMRSEDEARERFAQAADLLPSSIPESAMYAFEMDVNSLPPYRSIAGADLAAAVSVMEIDGRPQSLSVLLDNGKYLTTGTGGSIVYAVPYLPDSEQDTEQIVKEELWIRHPDGSHQQIGSGDFYDIREAQYSADGRYLGILDARTDDQVLFVYDTQTGDVSNLGEEGLGDFTTSFVWDGAHNTIYAMSGTDEALQLVRYDFDAPAGTPRVSSVEERNGSDSAIAYADGKIYFADQEDMMICQVDAATGERKELAPGTSMSLSPNGRYLAVLVMRPADEEEVTFDLVLLDAETGAELAQIMQGVYVEDFMFDYALDDLYFTTQNYEGTSADYPFALMRYSISTGETHLIGYSRSELIEIGNAPGRLYIIYYFTSTDSMKSMLPVTYVLPGQEG